MLPMSGYPFGPGGYGGFFLLFCHFQARANDAAAQSEAASRVPSSVMSRDKLGSHRSHQTDPGLYPVG